MRRRVVDTLPKNMAGRELKLGPGGLRDIEFAVQLLQLVHGRDDDRLRVPATLPALAALADGGYVGRADAEDLAQAYRFLRQTEHLLQLYQLRRTHTLPTDPAVLRRLGRALGSTTKAHYPERPRSSRGRFRDPPGLAASASPPEEAFTEAWTKTAQQVRRLHEKLFYRPLLDAVAKLPSGRGPAHPRGGQGPPRGAWLPRPGGRAAAHRGADLRAAPPGGDPADPAARAARLVRRRRPSRTPDCSRSARSARPWGRPPGSCGCCGTRQRPPSGWPACSPQAGTRPACCCAPPRPSRCSPTTPSWCRRPPTPSAPR